MSTGDRAFEVQQKCGEPVSQEVLGTQETFNSNYRRSEAVRIEEWIYGPDNGMYQYLRFEGGRLVGIEQTPQLIPLLPLICFVAPIEKAPTLQSGPLMATSL